MRPSPWRENPARKNGRIGRAGNLQPLGGGSVSAPPSPLKEVHMVGELKRAALPADWAGRVAYTVLQITAPQPAPS